MVLDSRRRVCLALLALSLAGACSKPNADEHFRKGNALVEQSHFPEAMIEYRLALQAAPVRGDIRLKLAELYLRNHDGGNALKEYVRAADQLPKDIGAQLKAGGLLLIAGGFEEAKGRAKRVLDLDPKNAEGQILLGNALAGLKDLDGALTEYQEALALNPMQDNAYVNIGSIQLARGQHDEAEASFRKAVDVAPKSVPARMALANFLWSSGRAPQAEQALKDALALDPTNVTANRALGVFYLASNRAKDAEPYFQSIADSQKTTAATLGLADYYVMVKRPDDAKRVLTDLAKKEDAYATATTRLAALDASEGQRAQALTKIGDVLAKYPKDASARLLEARVLLVDGKRDEALAQAETIIKDAANAAAVGEAYLIVGGIQARLDHRDEAVKAYEEVLRRQPRPLAAAMALTAMNLQSGSLEKANTYMQLATKIQPNNPQVRALAVRVALARGETTAANTQLASLQKEFPNSPAVLNLEAMQQMANHQLDAARASYTRVATAMPNDIEALIGLIRIDMQTGRTKDAIARIDSALKRIQPTGSFLTLAARTYASAKDFAKTEELLKRAIDVEPTYLEAYGLLGQLYVTQHRIDDAKESFQKVIELSPKSIPANTMLAMLFEFQQRLPEAELQYQKVLAIDSHAAVAANNLAWLYVASNRNLDTALQLAQTAVQQLPDEPHVNDTLGWIYYQKNMASQAIPPLESSIAKDPTDPGSHYHLGMAYAKQGDYEKAKKSLQRAFALKSDFEGAAEARKTLTMVGG